MSINNFFSNPKTTYGGILLLACTAAYLMKLMDTATYVATLGIVGAWIGVSSKDADK